METAISVLVLALIACVCIIRYQIKRERYLIELNNSNEMESSKTMVGMKEEISSLNQQVKDAREIGYRHLRLSYKWKEDIKKLTQQRNGYKGKVVQLVNERKVLRNELEITHGLLREALDAREIIPDTIQEAADSDEWPEIDITKVQVEPDAKFTYDGVRYIAKDNNRCLCAECCFSGDSGNCTLWEAKCKDIYFTKPE